MLLYSSQKLVQEWKKKSEHHSEPYTVLEYIWNVLTPHKELSEKGQNQELVTCHTEAYELMTHQRVRNESKCVPEDKKCCSFSGNFVYAQNNWSLIV